MTAGEDRATLAFYASEAAVYATGGDQAPSPHLADFLAGLPAGARILELGCGGGRDSAAMIAAGFAVEPSDGCPEMAAQAERRLGRPVRVMRFAELDAEERYDGVWANAALLHVPRANLAGVLARIRRALVPGGLFAASYKGGGGEGRDRLGRYFNFPDRDWLREAYDRAGDWASIDIVSRRGGGYDGVERDWHLVTVRK